MTLEFDRQGLQALLQARRQRAVAHELFLKTRRQISAALGEAGRQPLARVRVIAGDNLALTGFKLITAMPFAAAVFALLPLVAV